jgi:hypothetical protein
MIRRVFIKYALCLQLLVSLLFRYESFHACLMIAILVKHVCFDDFPLEIARLFE